MIRSLISTHISWILGVRAASIALYLKDTDIDFEDAEGKEQILQI